MKPHFLALYCLIGVAGVSAWSNSLVTVGITTSVGDLQPKARHQQPALLFASSVAGAVDAGTGAADTNDVAIEYNAAAKLAYDAWRRQHAPPRLKASQRVLLSAEDAAVGVYDTEKFATFERNYKIVTVANVRAKRAARMYGGEAEVVTLGPDADTVALPTPHNDEPDAPTAVKADTDPAAEDVDVSIQYNAPARLAYDEWLAANGRAGGNLDDSKFNTFEQNYIMVTVAYVSAKKAAREAKESLTVATPAMELGSNADSVLLSNIGDVDSTFPRGIFEEVAAGSKGSKIGSLSFGEQFGQAFQWKPSEDDRLRSALGIDASSSSDPPDTEKSAPFFFTTAGKAKETPHPLAEMPFDQGMNASDKFGVFPDGEGLESKTVAELRDMLKDKGMSVSGKRAELINRLQNANDTSAEVVKETQKAMEREYGISLSIDKIREILTPIFGGKIESNVSTDAIKGAALAGAALPILAGAKGAGLSLAALSALSSSYLAVTQGYGGDAARVVGDLTWKSTGALKSVGSASKTLLSEAVTFAKEKNREQMLEAVSKGDAMAAAKLDKDVQKVLAEAEEAVAAAEQATGRWSSSNSLDEETRHGEEEARLAEEAIKAAELARLQDEELLAKEFERARMEEMRTEASARAEQERIKEDQWRAEEDAARLAEEDRLGATKEEAADIAAQARAAVEEMEQMEGLPAFDEEDESFLGEEDLEAAIALAQELEDDKIAGVDDFLQALRELDVDGDFEGKDDGDFDEDDATFSDAPAQEEAQSPEDLARAAREAVATYEAEMAAKSKERKAQKSEWAEDVATAVVAASTDKQGEVDASPPAAVTTDWADLTVVKLKEELRSRGLKVGGKKADLVQRLQEDDMSR